MPDDCGEIASQVESQSQEQNKVPASLSGEARELHTLGGHLSELQ